MSRITITSATVCSESSGSDSVYSAYHLSLTDNPGRDEIGLKDLAIEKPKATQRSNGESATASGPRSGNAEKEYSLANQYLDTMIMDDVWRAACRKRIRQLQRKQRELKRLTFTAPKPLARISKIDRKSVV